MKILSVFAALMTCVLLHAPASAENSGATYPTRPIRLVVPFPPGGGVDINARLLAPLLAKVLGQPIIVENRAGAGGIIAFNYVASSSPDGYTLLLANVGLVTINPFLYNMADPRKVLAPISLIVKNPFVVWSSSTMPGANWVEFVKAVKEKPKAYNFASGGIGTINQLCGDLIKKDAGLNMPDIPYKGGAAALNDLVAGRVQAYCDVYGVGAPFLQARKIKALAVTSASRLAAMRDVPTLMELGFNGLEITGWQGVLAPAGTPRAVIDKLAGAVNQVVNSKAVQDAFAKLGIIPFADSPAQFGQVIESETTRWGRLVKETGMKLE